MDSLCSDMISYIGGFLPDPDLSKFTQTCKKHNQILRYELLKRKNEKTEHIRTNYPDWLIELVGIDRFVSLPCLEWNPKWLGGTDYIDRIKYGTSSSPMWYTIDQYRRSAFIVDVKAVIYYDDKTDEKDITICMFQRYTDGSGYTCGTNYGNVATEILTASGMINPTDENNLILKLIKDGEVEYIHDKDFWNKTLDRIVFTIA